MCIPDEPTNGTCMDVADTEKIYYEFTTTTTVDDFDLMITQPANMSKWASLVISRLWSDANII